MGNAFCGCISGIVHGSLNDVCMRASMRERRVRRCMVSQDSDALTQARCIKNTVEEEVRRLNETISSIENIISEQERKLRLRFIGDQCRTILYPLSIISPTSLPARYSCLEKVLDSSS